MFFLHLKICVLSSLYTKTQKPLKPNNFFKKQVFSIPGYSTALPEEEREHFALCSQTVT